MSQTPKQAQLAAKMKELEPDYRRYLDPEVMLKFKASVLDDVFEVFSGGVIRPEAAAFNVGRLFQALKPYREAVETIAEYEALEAKLAASVAVVDAELA